MMVPVLQSFGTQIGQAVQSGLLSGAVGAQNAMTGVGQGLTTAGRSGGKGGMLASMAGGAFSGGIGADMGSSAAGGGMANQSAGMMAHLPGGASFQSPAPAAPPPTGNIIGMPTPPPGGLTPQAANVASQVGNRMQTPGAAPFVTPTPTPPTPTPTGGVHARQPSPPGGAMPKQPLDAAPATPHVPPAGGGKAAQGSTSPAGSPVVNVSVNIAGGGGGTGNGVLSGTGQGTKTA